MPDASRGSSVATGVASGSTLKLKEEILKWVILTHFMRTAAEQQGQETFGAIPT